MTKTPLKVQLKQAEEKSIRALAEMENMRRREAENKKTWSTLAVGDFLRGVLPRLSELGRLMGETEDENSKKVIMGLFTGLSGAGLVEISPEKAEKIDPDKHEVLMTAEGEPGTVVTCLEKGWELNGKVLLPAKVSASPES